MGATFSTTSSQTDALFEKKCEGGPEKEISTPTNVPFNLINTSTQ